MKILFFGRLSDASETMELDLPNSVKTTYDLQMWLADTNPALNLAFKTKGNRVAVNKNMVDGNVPITNDDEVAFMSPLSGG